mgnify:CR=1 FL=1
MFAFFTNTPLPFKEYILCPEKLYISTYEIPNLHIQNIIIIEHNKTIFEIQTFATSREQAKAISDNWNNNAEELYPKILEILTQKLQEAIKLTDFFSTLINNTIKLEFTLPYEEINKLSITNAFVTVNSDIKVIYLPSPS